MANAVKGEVAFSSGGEDYILVFDFNALCELEEEFGVQASKLGEVIGTKAKNIRTVFRIGLGRHQDLSDEAAGDIITEIGPQKAGELITEGFTRAYPEAAKGTGNPRKARRAGTG